MRAQYDLICRAFAKLDVQEPMLIRNCVSFKAGGTNMVDIIPLRHQLRCYLNTTREQLSDPHGMIDRCRDPLRQDSHRVLLPVLRVPESPDPLASTSGPPRSGS